MIILNGLSFYEKPHSCGSCTAFVAGSNDAKGFCVFFNLQKKRWDKVPARCVKMFNKAFKIGGNLVITLKN